MGLLTFVLSQMSPIKWNMQFINLEKPVISTLKKNHAIDVVATGESVLFY